MHHPDYEQLALDGMPAERLAETFLRAYFIDKEPEYPLNPFQMLKDMGIAFSLRPFKKCEGMYIPAEDDDDIPVVGINSNSPIARQRFTAAHELCHHLKDGHSTIVCAPNAQSKVERYAEAFAAELLMPSAELKRQVDLYIEDDCVEFIDALRIAEHFGVSFQACLYRLAWRIHCIEGDTSPKSLGTRRHDFRPNAKRHEMGFSDVKLYEQLFDAGEEYLKLEMTPKTRQYFKTEYVFHDSRMEGIETETEKAAEIVVDLRLKGTNSEYCKSENQNIIEVAGLSIAYDYVFDSAADESFEISVYEAKKLNEKLFSVAPHPEFGGRYREANPLVIGTKFETADRNDVPNKMRLLGDEVQNLMESESKMTASSFIEAALHIHYELTIIHAFRDGNGRTTRAFTNMMLTRRGLPPTLFKDSQKNSYKDALAKIDSTGNYADLYETYFKALIQTQTELSDC